MKNLTGKWVAVCLAAVMVFSLSACGSKDTAGESTAGSTGFSAAESEASGSEAREEKLKLAVILKNKGDRSFEQSLYEGALRIEQEMSDQYEVRIIEADPGDQATWQPAMEAAASDGADIIAGAGYEFRNAMDGAAKNYKDTRFILLDDILEGQSNVLSVMFHSNEAAFLAGAAAAYYTTGENAANTDKTIGFIGGEPSDVVNNLLAGYAQGAHYVDPDMKILSAFTASYTDTDAARETAADQMLEGVDILFGAAGASGAGVMEAASSKDGVMAIGVDSDQYETFEGTDLQPVILTSCLKELGTALYDICESYYNDPSSIAFGTTIRFGLKEGAIGLVYNDNLMNGIGETHMNRIREIEQKIISGELTVSGAEGLSHEELSALVFP